MKTYTELMTLPTFEERVDYLMLHGTIGEPTFGYDRWLNQKFYTSYEWRKIRKQIAIRDDGCDLGCEDHPISGRIHVHHINPITKEDIINHDPKLFDPNNLISVSELTHQALTYGLKDLLPKPPVVRKPYDTCPWRSECLSENSK
ncbi:MAG: hypothetical protein J6X94_03470 [Lachnospiraceae bacterium]|nr:hypothetical protein [Lachnospiraceae bacterium]